MSCECPICMDPIMGDKNKVITECGHCFHTNCLMTSVAHNGFGCPYCRTAMAEEQNDDDDDEENSYGSDDEEEVESPYDNEYVLRGFRLFMANKEGEDHDEEDLIQEQYEEQLEEAAEERANDHELLTQEPMPSVAYVTEKLTERGVTLEDLVKVFLVEHDAYNFTYGEQEATERLEGEIYGKVRIIIGGYTPRPNV